MKKYKPNIIFFISIFMSILIHLILIEKIDIKGFISNSNKKNKDVEIDISIQETKLKNNLPKKINKKSKLSRNDALKQLTHTQKIVKTDSLNPSGPTNIKTKNNTDNIITNISTFSSTSTEINKTSSLRIKNISSKSRDYMYKLYFESWKRKVERVGAMNYPESAKNSGIFGSLLLTVSLNSDGLIKKMTIIKSSGKKDLDEATLNIVRMGEPYAKFPARMKDEVDIVTITRRWKFSKDNNFE